MDKKKAAMSLKQTELTVQLAHVPEDLPAVQAIFREYVQSPKADLGFQNDETALVPETPNVQPSITPPASLGSA
jgi:hypothetical protein